MDSINSTYQYALTIYEYMLDNSLPGVTNDNTGVPLPVYEGFLSKELEEKLGIKGGQYTRSINILLDTTCIYKIRRGVATTPAQWGLIKSPVLEEVLEADRLNAKKRQRNKLANNQQIRDIMSSIAEIRIELDEVIARIEALELGEENYG